MLSPLRYNHRTKNIITREVALPYDPRVHHRRSIRLSGYDYTLAGGYFITLVAYQHQQLFGEIRTGQMHPNKVGEIVLQVWQDIPQHFLRACLDSSVLMPNHFHAIILFSEGDPEREDALHPNITGNPNLPPKMGTKPGSLGAVIQSFKSVTARKINKLDQTPGAKIWQRNYFEHIIRNEKDLQRIREYIFNNPLNWESDEENQPPRGKK